jgi:hypothetical protein
MSATPVRTGVPTADRRPRASFSDAELLRLAAEAKACRLSKSAYVVKALVAAWGEGARPERVLPIQPFPAIDPTAKVRRRAGPKLSMSDAERTKLGREAKACRKTQAKYIHAAVLACWGEAKVPKKRPSLSTDELVHALSLLSFQVKKLGNNVNQLAKQANTGLVPVARAEGQYMLNQQQMLLSQCSAAVEKIIA